MEALFFCLLFLLFYPYVIYPVMVLFWAYCFGRGWHQEEMSLPVSIIISVYNEEQVIRNKIENTLSLNYPADLLEIIVSSDGSDDTTNEIVASFDDPRVVLKAFPDRSGKTVCLNRVVPMASGDVILFTDANSMLPPDTLKKVTRNFADPGVGLVTGWTRYIMDGKEETTGIYSRLEMHTKAAESQICSCVGADGAVFAIKKELYQSLKDEDINDFVIPLNVIGFTKRVIMDPEVYCFEEPSPGGRSEFKRQIRITNRTLGAIKRGKQFLNPFDYSCFSFFLLSHKLLRFLVPVFFVGTLLSALFLYDISLCARWVLSAQVVFVGVGVLGLIRPLDSRLINLCKFFLLTIAAQTLGWFRFVTGKTDTVWTPQR